MKHFEIKVLVENASELAANDQEAFGLIRRQGIGASDTAALLGVSPFPNGTTQELIYQKQAKYMTAAELAIGQMVNVRKGNDLEPLILAKFMKMYKVEDVSKPSAMYGIVGTPLTVNFDGIMGVGAYMIPVECKFISSYGGKYYNFSKCMSPNELSYGKELMPLADNLTDEAYIMARANEAGIPVYYYTQVQQQMMGLNAPFCYLTCLAEKDWESRTFCIMRDERVQQLILDTAEVVWARVKAGIA